MTKYQKKLLKTFLSTVLFGIFVIGIYISLSWLTFIYNIYPVLRIAALTVVLYFIFFNTVRILADLIKL